MNDINWRYLDNQEDLELIQKNPMAFLLIETDVFYRMDLARAINVNTGNLNTCKEKAVRFAVIQ